MPSIKINKREVDALPLVEAGQVIYWDRTLKGFGIRITPGSKTYVVQKKIDGRAVRISLGAHGLLTPDQARDMALQELAAMARGINPRVEKQAARAAQVTLGDAFGEYLLARKELKPRTIVDYKFQMEKRFSDWLGRPVRGITKNMIQQRHADIAKGSGPAQANQAMRVLRAVMNFAMAKFETNDGQPLLLVNPVKRLSDTRAWYRVDRKRSYIRPDQFKPWLDALDRMRDEDPGRAAPDFFEVILFTGMRRHEAATLQWGSVDMVNKTFTLLDTKNHQPHTLPMSNHVHGLLARRYEARQGDSPWVFPGPGKNGYYADPARALATIVEYSGVASSVHDLRRSFVTLAESLDIGGYTLKRLINHKQAGDVTAGYIIHDVERLRGPMERIANEILRKAGRIGNADVIQFRPAGSGDNV